MKLMVVDDNKQMRTMIREIASQRTDIVMECIGGEEAVEQYAGFLPDFVLMDIEMEPMDGFAATERIMQIDTAAKIIFVTTHNDAMHREKAESLRVQGFVAKDNLIQLKQIIHH